jgi:hypothetical protein
MGKSVGFIGNFKGKLGNAVGYKVSQSNSGTNQGVRVYQPNIKNPKSAAQAEQRAKYAPIFATYNALKSIIDRGNESKPYGNASRIAWLSKAFRTSEIPWIKRGELVEYPIGCQLTRGSLNNIPFGINGDLLVIYAPNEKARLTIDTVGELSEILMNYYSFLKKGDQVTFITQIIPEGSLIFTIFSIIIDDENTELVQGFSYSGNRILMQTDDSIISASIIISREGTHGEHLRSTSRLEIENQILSNYPYRPQDKQAAIASYMATTGANTDWAEESIQ